MASIGANPINSIGVEKQFPTGSNGYPLSVERRENVPRGKGENGVWRRGGGQGGGGG